MDIYWLWLSSIPYVGPFLQKQLLYHFGTPVAVYEASEQELQKVARITSRAIQSIMQNHSLEKATHIYKQCCDKKIKILTFNNENYSEIAKSCPESPIVLYGKGNVRRFENSVAIIGSRRCSDYGKKITAQIAADISKKNIPIISGLAKGIDSYAHTIALKSNGYTIAFLANGVDICYPPEHRSLYEEIIQNGAILSKYPPGTKAYPKYFLERNALISAWADYIIIVEAGEKSGTLTTARFAHKYNRKIFVVPNRIDVPEGKGSNALLESIANPYLGIESLNINHTDVTTTTKLLNQTRIEVDNYNITEPIEMLLLKSLQSGPIRILDLGRLLKITREKLDELLFLMELKEQVKIQGEFVLLRGNHQ